MENLWILLAALFLSLSPVFGYMRIRSTVIIYNEPIRVGYTRKNANPIWTVLTIVSWTFFVFGITYAQEQATDPALEITIGIALTVIGWSFQRIGANIAKQQIENDLERALGRMMQRHHQKNPQVPVNS